MADDRLSERLASLDGDDPAPEFVAALRQRLDDELTGAASDAPEIVDLGAVAPVPIRQKVTAMKNWWIAGVGTAAAAVLIIVGVLWATRDDDGESISTNPDRVADTTPQPSSTPEPTDTPTVAPVGLDPAAELLVAQEVTIDAGSYRVETLGTPFTLTLGQRWAVQPNRDGRFVISDPRATAPGQNDLIFLRASQLIDPTNPRAPATERGEGWPVHDIGGWIDAVIPEIQVTNVEDTTVGGSQAITFDVEVADELGCVTGACIEFATNTRSDAFFGPDALYRVWWISQGDLDPIIVVASALQPPDEYLALVDAVIASLAIGDPAPNPVP